MVRLRGVNYGNVLQAPGVNNFDGNGYTFHKALRLVPGYNWSGSTFAAKTTTYDERVGNMPLSSDLMPKEFNPKCIIAKPLCGHVLNAVSLSGPGAVRLVTSGIWQSQTDPFVISFMAVGETRDDRRLELMAFVRLLLTYYHEFHARFALMIDFGCPNVGLHLDELGEEIEESREIASVLKVPLIANFSVAADIKLILKASGYDAVWIANTVPWGTAGIDFEGIFGTKESPLAKRGFGNGGLSGPACLPMAIEKIQLARAAFGRSIQIIGGNGIQDILDAKHVFDAGADAIAVGVVSFLRPWRLQSIIDYANTRGK